MWDVVWTDPDKELVGEHRAKKGSDEARNNKKKPKSRSGRASISTTSSKSSIEPPFSLFRGRGPKRNIASAPSQADMALTIAPSLESPGIASSRSPFSQDFLESSRPSSDRASSSILDRNMICLSSVGPPPPGRLVESTSGISRSTSNDVDSIFSSSIADTTTTSSTDDVLEDAAMTESEKMRSIIQILEDTVPPTSDSGIFRTPEWGKHGAPAGSSESLLQEDTRTRGVSTPPASPTHSSRPSLSSLHLGSPTSSIFPMPPVRSPLKMFSPSRNGPQKPSQKNAQKESDNGDWTPPGSRGSMLETLKQEPIGEEGSKESSTLDTVNTLEEDMVMMAKAHAKEQVSVLQRLWSQTNSTGPNTLREHGREVLQMRRWMLSAVHHTDLRDFLGKAHTLKEPSVTASMVLVLHESSDLVSYLATLHPSKQLYDLSVGTRSYEKLPNIRSIPVASTNAGEFPVAPGIFEAVHSMTLPSQCLSNALGGIVQSVARSLKVGGAFHLTIIDPLPRAGTMGPKMRAWIQKYLLRNLARAGRCMSPSTLFPQLLGDAGLRSKGSTLTTTKFFGVPESARSGGYCPDFEMARLRAESEVKAEFRSLVGRMLWVEVWGAYMTAEKWWWEDEACVQECLELGTFWEYHTIKGVRGEERRGRP